MLRLRTMISLVFATLVIPLGLLIAPAAHAQPFTKAAFNSSKALTFGHIINRNSGKCLWGPGAGVLQATCSSDPGQDWQLEYISSSADYRIRNRNTNRCLAVADGIKNVVQELCSSDNRVRWVVYSQGDYVRLSSSWTAKLATVHTLAENAYVVQEAYQEFGSVQQWYLAG